MQLDQNTANVLIAFFAVVNTAMLVYQAVRLQQVHSSVNGARQAAVDAAHLAGLLAGQTRPDAPMASPQPPQTTPAQKDGL